MVSTFYLQDLVIYVQGLTLPFAHVSCHVRNSHIFEGQQFDRRGFVVGNLALKVTVQADTLLLKGEKILQIMNHELSLKGSISA